MGRAICFALAALSVLTGCGKKSEEVQMQQYMEFYYPSTTESTYEIVFDWGQYVISTHTPVSEKVHADAEKYRGYITMRPSAAQPSVGAQKATYLITPEGQVWALADASGIAASGSREEITKDGGSTSTVTVQSPSEPVIDHFLANPDAWKRYGTVEGSDGKYKFKPAT